MTEFEGIVPAIAEAMLKRGYTGLTPVQQSVLDPALGERDALVSARTGSGKTVAFGLALAPSLLKGAERFGRAGAPLALVVAPTRELALQVNRELEWLYELTGATVASCVGGMDMRTERRVLERGAHIVVGTPGRLRDHITRGSLVLDELAAVVLDEADEMLDLGFREDLEFILENSPEERRTLMFSATVPRSIAQLAQNYQRDAVRIEAGGGDREQHHDIEYRAMLVAPTDRENAIINALRFYEAKNAIVFCSTRAAVNHMTSRFNNRGFSVVALSGELSQNERSHALQAMRDGRARVCIATDVAARGIDLPGLELVVHADLPTNPETLLHRSGRTGRAGQKGVSALIVPLPARRRAERVLNDAKITAAWVNAPSADEIHARDAERMLADPVLTDRIREDEAETISDLLKNHSAEQVAAAFLRLYRAGHSAPEELTEITVFDAKRKRERTERPGFERPERSTGPREDFGDSVWFSLSVGRRQNAEPRWLIPMLCRNTQISKRDIGAIKMQQTETYVEISADSVEAFEAGLGPNRMLENSIRVTALPGKPDFSKREAPVRRSEDGEHREKRWDRDRAEPKGEWRPRKEEAGRDFDRPSAKPKFAKPAGKGDHARNGKPDYAKGAPKARKAKG
jgi:ATP-dependent RNA helicase DeaD